MSTNMLKLKIARFTGSIGSATSWLDAGAGSWRSRPCQRPGSGHRAIGASCALKVPRCAARAAEVITASLLPPITPCSRPHPARLALIDGVGGTGKRATVRAGSGQRLDRPYIKISIYPRDQHLKLGICCRTRAPSTLCWTASVPPRTRRACACWRSARRANGPSASSSRSSARASRASPATSRSWPRPACSTASAKAAGCSTGAPRAARAPGSRARSAACCRRRCRACALDQRRLEAVREAPPAAGRALLRRPCRAWDSERDSGDRRRHGRGGAARAVRGGAAGQTCSTSAPAPAASSQVLAGQVGFGLGIDLSHDMLAVARANLDQREARNCQVRHGDMYQLPLPDASFAAATLHQVLHFADDPFAALAEAARVLAPGRPAGRRRSRAARAGAAARASTRIAGSASATRRSAAGSRSSAWPRASRAGSPGPSSPW